MNTEPSTSLCVFLEKWHQTESVNYHCVGLFYDSAKLKGDLSISHKTGYLPCPPSIPTHISMKEYVESLLHFHANLSNSTHWGPEK
jgi:hypothetical protein